MNLKKTLILMYVVALNFLLVVLVFRPHWVMPERAISPHIIDMKAAHRRMDPIVPEGATIFLGDSITEGLAVIAVTPNALNFGIGRLTTQQLLDGIPDYRSLQTARQIYLLIGINDFAQNKSDGIEDRLAAIALALPDRPLAWSGIMPVNTDSIPSEQIQKVNMTIRSLCSAKKKCTYIDTWDALAPNGSVTPSDYADGVHLGESGYRKWIDSLKRNLE